MRHPCVVYWKGYTQLCVTACVGIHYFQLIGDRKIYSTLLYLVNVCNRGRMNVSSYIYISNYCAY